MRSRPSRSRLRAQASGMPRRVAGGVADKTLLDDQLSSTRRAATGPQGLGKRRALHHFGAALAAPSSAPSSRSAGSPWPAPRPRRRPPGPAPGSDLAHSPGAETQLRQRDGARGVAGRHGGDWGRVFHGRPASAIDATDPAGRLHAGCQQTDLRPRRPGSSASTLTATCPGPRLHSAHHELGSSAASSSPCSSPSPRPSAGS